MENLLVVVDMVNGFIKFGALADKNIEKIIPNVEKAIKFAKQNKMQIVEFEDCHNSNDAEFQIYPVHCLCGSLESEIIDELKQYKQDMLTIKKNTTNGFKTEQFLNLVQNNEFKDVFVVGCCTDICVQEFVSSYQNFIQQNNKKTNIFVVSDACYTFNSDVHNALQSHEKALKEMEKLGAKIVDSKIFNLEAEVC